MSVGRRVSPAASTSRTRRMAAGGLLRLTAEPIRILDPERLSQGVPLLAGVAFDPLQTALEQSVDAMLAVMQRVLHMKP